MDNKDLSIIIVSWNVKEKLRENLQALFLSVGEIDFEVFVVDNNSNDSTADMVEKEFPLVKLTRNYQNLGFAKANNQAIKSASGEFVLLLNPDMKVSVDTLVNMLTWMKVSKQAAVAGCHLIDENGAVVRHVRRFPTIWDQLAIVLKIPHLLPVVLKQYLREDFDYDQPARVDSVRGGFFMLRKETIEKVGLLDEQYFIWFEEVDYCKRVYEQGLEVWYTPNAECIDFVGQSFKQVKRGVTQKYFQESMLKYFKKWHPAWQYYLLKFSWPFGKVAVAIGGIFNVKPKAQT